MKPGRKFEWGVLCLQHPGFDNVLVFVHLSPIPGISRKFEKYKKIVGSPFFW